MTRHSKNACSSATFSSQERSKLLINSSNKSLTNNSPIEFDTCYLCLDSPAQDPAVVCERGHVSCKECAVLFILNQKKALKEKRLKHFEAEILKCKIERQQEDLCRIQAESDFIRQQAAISILPSFAKKESQNIKNTIDCLCPDSSIVSPNPLIFCGREPHSISLKTLFPIELTRTCPSCSKSLCPSGTSVSSLVPCGHIFCKECLSMTCTCPLCSISIIRIIELNHR
jgi:hypothetical protein